MKDMLAADVREVPCANCGRPLERKDPPPGGRLRPLMPCRHCAPARLEQLRREEQEHERRERDHRVTVLLESAGVALPNQGRSLYDTRYTEIDMPLARAATYLKGWNPLSGESWYLFGPAGVGKTTLGSAVVLDLIRRRIMPAMLLPEYLLVEASRNFEAKRMGDDPLKEWVEIPGLVIDDLGQAPVTQWTRHVLFTILERRLQRGLGVGLTGNMPLHDRHDRTLRAIYGEPIESRVAGMCRGRVFEIRSSYDKRRGGSNVGR